jgi:hypothetical protein
MTGKRSELLAAVQFLWELVRFFGLFALALLRFRGTLVEDRTAVLWLIALASGQLLAPAGLALFIYSPGRRGTLLPFLRLAKILQMFPALLLVLALAPTRGLSLLGLPFVPSRFALASLPGFALAAVLLAASVVDLIFLLVLFTTRAEAEPGREPDTEVGTEVGQEAGAAQPGRQPDTEVGQDAGEPPSGGP